MPLHSARGLRFETIDYLERASREQGHGSANFPISSCRLQQLSEEDPSWIQRWLALLEPLCHKATTLPACVEPENSTRHLDVDSALVQRQHDYMTQMPCQFLTCSLTCCSLTCCSQMCCSLTCYSLTDDDVTWQLSTLENLCLDEPPEHRYSLDVFEGLLGDVERRVADDLRWRRSTSVDGFWRDLLSFDSRRDDGVASSSTVGSLEEKGEWGWAPPSHRIDPGPRACLEWNEMDDDGAAADCMAVFWRQVGDDGRVGLNALLELPESREWLEGWRASTRRSWDRVEEGWLEPARGSRAKKVSSIRYVRKLYRRFSVVAPPVVGRSLGGVDECREGELTQGSCCRFELARLENEEVERGSLSSSVDDNMWTEKIRAASLDLTSIEEDLGRVKRALEGRGKEWRERLWESQLILEDATLPNLVQVQISFFESCPFGVDELLNRVRSLPMLRLTVKLPEVRRECGEEERLEAWLLRPRCSTPPSDVEEEGPSARRWLVVTEVRQESRVCWMDVARSDSGWIEPVELIQTVCDAGVARREYIGLLQRVLPTEAFERLMKRRGEELVGCLREESGRFKLALCPAAAECEEEMPAIEERMLSYKLFEAAPAPRAEGRSEALLEDAIGSYMATRGVPREDRLVDAEGGDWAGLDRRWIKCALAANAMLVVCESVSLRPEIDFHCPTEVLFVAALMREEERVHLVVCQKSEDEVGAMVDMYRWLLEIKDWPFWIQSGGRLGEKSVAWRRDAMGSKNLIGSVEAFEWLLSPSTTDRQQQQREVDRVVWLTSDPDACSPAKCFGWASKDDLKLLMVVHGSGASDWLRGAQKVGRVVRECRIEHLLVPTVGVEVDFVDLAPPALQMLTIADAVERQVAESQGDDARVVADPSSRDDLLAIKQLKFDLINHGFEVAREHLNACVNRAARTAECALRDLSDGIRAIREPGGVDHEKLVRLEQLVRSCLEPHGKKKNCTIEDQFQQKKVLVVLSCRSQATWLVDSVRSFNPRVRVHVLEDNVQSMVTESGPVARGTPVLIASTVQHVYERVLPRIIAAAAVVGYDRFLRQFTHVFELSDWGLSRVARSGRGASPVVQHVVFASFYKHDADLTLLTPSTQLSLAARCLRRAFPCRRFQAYDVLDVAPPEAWTALADERVTWKKWAVDFVLVDVRQLSKLRRVEKAFERAHVLFVPHWFSDGEMAVVDGKRCIVYSEGDVSDELEKKVGALVTRYEQILVIMANSSSAYFELLVGCRKKGWWNVYVRMVEAVTEAFGIIMAFVNEESELEIKMEERRADRESAASRSSCGVEAGKARRRKRSGRSVVNQDRKQQQRGGVEATLGGLAACGGGGDGVKRLKSES